jgi:peptidoglycan/xylan/chitin deacetylase (PgdA/CDA1 family)
MIKNVVDFMLDRRMPHYIPYTLLRKMWVANKIRKASISTDNPIMIAITFDVESDFGSCRMGANYKSVSPFLREIKTIVKQKGIKPTFFLQGNLIDSFVDILRTLQKSGEIGLHGYSHELWGDRRWFLKDRPLPLMQKEKLLSKAVGYFSGNKLDRPVSFRAPHMVIDIGTLRLLKKYGFYIDSSAPSYYGRIPIPSRPLGYKSKLLSIPVTVDPIPNYSQRYLIPYSYYKVFNMKNLALLNEGQLIKHIDNVLRVQKTFGCITHLVFLAHSWEFSDWRDTKEFKYCSSENYNLLMDRLSKLEDNYRLNYITMKELYRILIGSNHEKL